MVIKSILIMISILMLNIMVYGKREREPLLIKDVITSVLIDEDSITFQLKKKCYRNISFNAETGGKYINQSENPNLQVGIHKYYDSIEYLNLDGRNQNNSTFFNIWISEDGSNPRIVWMYHKYYSDEIMKFVDEVKDLLPRKVYVHNSSPTDFRKTDVYW